MHTLKYLLILLGWTASASLLLSQSLPTSFTHTLSDGTDSYTINFSRFSSRGPLFEVAVQQADGSFQTVNVGDARTYIGTVTGEPGAVASCVRRANGDIYTRMTFENGFEWIDYDGSLTIQERDLTPTWPTFGMRSGGAGSTLYACDIFIDLTNRYYGTAGGTAAECMEMVDFSMTSLNLIYMRDVNLINRIGRVQIRADLSNDPYANDGGVMSNLLSTLATEGNAWVNGSNATTDHDLATVIQSLVGGGLANVGTVGTGRSANGGFSLGDFTGAARHEFGHNWGMSHYDGRGAGETQSPEGKTINSGNGLAKMSAPEAELALGERDDAIAVLTNLGTTAPSLPPRAADDRLTIDSILAGQSLTVSPLDNDNDANGESLSIVSVDSTTFLGASVSLVSATDTLEVSFPSSYAYGYDYFRYQISDQSGRTSTAVVHLQMSPPTMEWEIAPTPIDGDSLLMMGSDKFEGPGAIEYLFEHVNGTQSSSWQNSRSYIANSLTTGQPQTFRVYARIANGTSSSSPAADLSATPLNISAGTILSDTFNRSTLDDATGQSGAASPVGYSLTTFGPTSAGLVSNRISIDGPAGDGSYGGLVSIDDFNFGSPLMNAFDEVSIKVDISNYSTVGSSRQMALGIGQSLSELENQGGADPASSSADLMVAFRQTTNTLEIYKNGTLVSGESVTGSFPTAPTTMELVYETTSLEEGATATYEVYLDGNTTPHTSGSFTWSGTYQNYLSLSSNLTNASTFDNLTITASTSPGYTPPPINVPSFTPDPAKKYYIDSPHHGLRLAATGAAEDPYTTATTTTGDDVEWVFVDKGNGSWHIQLAAGGSLPRIRSRNNGEPDMQATSSSGSWTYYDFTLGNLEDTHFITLPDHDASRSRLQIDSSGGVNFVSETSAGTWESFRITEVPNYANLVAHWPIDETSGSQVGDTSGNEFHGTQTNATSTTGFLGNALSFNGSSSTVSIPASTFASISDEISVSMWLYGGSGQARNDSLFYAEDASGGRVLNIHLPWSNSQVYWDAGYDGQYDRINKAAASGDFKGQWNHWVFSKNSSTGVMEIYLNGSLWHSGSGKTKSISGITNACFGSGLGTHYYEGMIDELMIFNRSLTSTEVTTLYNDQLAESQAMALKYVPTDYESWVLDLEVYDLGLADHDYDRDGLTNDEERIWGLDPADPQSSTPFLQTLGQDGTLQYTRRNPALTGMVYTVWTSTNLLDWTEDTEAIQESLSASDAETETIHVTLGEVKGEQTLFARIVADLPAEQKSEE
ncbi:MAG: LamG-like jellyroll fold domain-containing protein [Verrucomicrobiota bacterium JB023]|nr:LamG-like jellyroll fold domain-containing protein [Verrucomicrobiota bacterium JB023]